MSSEISILHHTARAAAGRPASRSAVRAVAQLAGLVLPVDCVGCGRPDVALCTACRAELAGPAGRVPLTAWPTGPPAYAALAYAGVARDVVVRWKDRGRHDVTAQLAVLLARAVLAVPEVTETERARQVSSRTARGVALVPVPSSRAAVRRRGEALVGRLALQAAWHVRRGGGRVRVLPALRLARRVADQAGLGRAGRSANLDRAMALRPSAGRVLAGRYCVVVDDVLTTGVTVREACRVLQEAGATVSAVAACCATPLFGGLSDGAHLH